MPRQRKGYHWILASSWILGLLCGIWFSVTAGTPFQSLVFRLPFGAISTVGALYSVILPFLLTILGLLFLGPAFVMPLGFFKAFSCSLVSLGLLQQFGSSGWLICCIVLFRSMITVPLLYLFWLRCLSCGRSFLDGRTALILALGILAAALDYRIISPILSGLIFV